MTYTDSQKHRSTLLQSPYVCTERIFDSRPFTYNKILLKKLLKKLTAHILTLLLAPFASKLANYSRRSETFNFRKNSKSTTFSFENSDFAVFIHFSKTHCTSTNWPIWTQKVPKEACRCKLPSFVRVLTKKICFKLLWTNFFIEFYENMKCWKPCIMIIVMLETYSRFLSTSIWDDALFLLDSRKV